MIIEITKKDGQYLLTINGTRNWVVDDEFRVAEIIQEQLPEYFKEEKIPF